MTQATNICIMVAGANLKLVDMFCRCAALQRPYIFGCTPETRLHGIYPDLIYLLQYYPQSNYETERWAIMLEHIKRMRLRGSRFIEVSNWE